MKILQLISGALGQGGAERLVIDLSDEMAANGHEVTICSFRKPAAEVVENIGKSVTIHSFGKSKGFDPLLPFKIADYIRKEHFEVVNSHLPAVFPYLIWSLMTCNDVKFVYTVHSNPSDEEPRKTVRWLRKMFIDKGKLTFVGISDIVGKNFAALYGLNQTIPVICNGRKAQKPTGLFHGVEQEIEGYKKDNGTKVFIAVGRLTREKNYRLMIEAFRALKDENMILVVLGKDYDGFLERCENEIPSNVHFLGGKDNVIDYLYSADCFIMSSLYEGFPISIIEAISAGLPIISTPVGGIPDVVRDGVNGFLSDSLETEDFVKAVKRFLESSESDLMKIREANKMEFAKKYVIGRTAELYIALYNIHQTNR